MTSYHHGLFVMTDLEQFVELFDNVDQSYTQYEGDEINHHDVGLDRAEGAFSKPIHTVIKIKTDKHNAVGYSGFFTCFYFDVDGGYLGNGSFE